MKGGYTGQTLNINLTKQTYQIEYTQKEIVYNYIGAKGLGAKILIDKLPPKTPPLSPENILLFTTGPLTGTPAQTSGRGTVVTKSPQTNLFLDSHFGGAFAAETKKAGWDYIQITGKSKQPIYITINNQHIEFHDAKPLKHMECLQTHKWLLNKHGKKTKTAVIGPAGENLVLFSAITIDGHRHAGRGGAGAVMGSKNLKALTMQGTQKIPLYDEKRFKQKAKEVLQNIQNNSFIPTRRQFGTPYLVKPISDWGFIPTNNFQEGKSPNSEAPSAESMQKSIVDSSGACWNCVIACWNKSSIKKGPYKGTSLTGPEYETFALMGTNLGIETVEELAYLNERCNELGMDTISLGVVLSFAIEAYQKGIITKKQLTNIDINWGKTKEIADLITAIAYQKGTIPTLLGQGVGQAAKKLGNNTQTYAMHVKNLEIPGYDPRGSFGMGLAYATSDRGACHQRAWTSMKEMKDPQYNRFSFEKKAQLVKTIQDERSAFFSLVFCDFAPITEQECTDLWNLTTGFTHTTESYLQAGERIWNLIRLFNLREGMKPSDDWLPSRFFNETFTDGPAKNIKLNEQEFQKCLKKYYTLRGWNSQGIPTQKTLQHLNLIDYQSIITNHR